MTASVSINGQVYSELKQDEFEILIRETSIVSDIEIWINYSEGPIICALINAAGGWLMFLRYAGDVGFSSRNAARISLANGTEAYRLANGQVDEYPSFWAFDRLLVFDALREFFRTGQKPTSVDWEQDS